MLALDRNLGEDIIITVPGVEPITVKSIAIRGQRARIGIEAVREVTVDRAEITERIKKEGCDRRKPVQRRPRVGSWSGAGD